MNLWRIALITFFCICSIASFFVLYYLQIILANWYVALPVTIGLIIGYAILIKVANKNDLVMSRIIALVLIVLA